MRLMKALPIVLLFAAGLALLPGCDPLAPQMTPQIIIITPVPTETPALSLIHI